MPTGCPKAPLIDRFLKRVNKNGKIVSPELGNCWEWTGAKYLTGYGELHHKTWDAHTTHAWSYMHFNDEIIPDGLEVRHKCDNRICCNPDHLELGTRKQNVDDMLERHPKPCGRKFTKEQVLEIKALRAEGKYYKDIAALYDCSRRTIEKLCLMKTY
jgi:hypothetical protein